MPPSINATNSGSGEKFLAPAGTHLARCYEMIHIGTINDTFEGKQKLSNKVRISWELPNEKKIFKEGEAERPYSVSKEYTLSMGDRANLRKMLESWRGQGFTEEQCKSFDITKLLGIPCMLSVIHKTTKKGSTYAEISAVTSVPKGTVVPDQINKTTVFTYENFNEEEFKKLPQWIQDIMKGSQEYKAMTHPENTEIVSQEANTQNLSSDHLPF